MPAIGLTSARSRAATWQVAEPAGVTTAVVLVVAAVAPHDAWQQPILRLADIIVGVAIGVGASWLGLRLVRPRIKPAS